MQKSVAMRSSDLWKTLPPEWSETDLRTWIRETTCALGRKVVVLDDDPTGTQTVRCLPVLTEWPPEALAAAWEEAETTFYLLTNSRRYPVMEAATMNREIACNLAQVARTHGVEPVVVSRSDSTLRGHYPGKVSVLVQTLEAELGVRYDGVILVPFFLEGERYIINDIHWVQVGDELIPAAQTEFALDSTFGYRHSNLREWVEEKTRGQVTVNSVLSISLEDIRLGGPRRVAELLGGVTERRVIVVNAAAYRDLEVFVWGMIQAEKQSKHFLFRTAASFVKVCGGIPDRGLLTAEEMRSTKTEEGIGGLTLVGSYVQRTTEQLGQALRLSDTVGLELRVARVLDEEGGAEET